MCDLAWEMAQRDSDEAKKLIDEAYALSKEIDYTFGEATALHNYGNLYDLTGEYEKALDYLDQALKMRIEIKDSMGQAMTYNSIGVIYDVRGEFKEALQYYIKSLKISDLIDDVQGVAYAQNNVAVMYKFLNQPEMALDYYNKSLETFIKMDDKHAIAATYSNIGIIQKISGDYEAAEVNQKKSIELFNEIGDIQGSLISLNSLGALYTEIDRNPEAKEIFNEALDKSRQMGDKEGIAISLANLGDVSVNLQNYDAAFRYYEDAISIGNQLQLRNLLEHVYGSMASVSAEIGRYKDAYNYLRRHTTIKDSMLNEESVRAMTEMETKYQSEKKEMQINMLQQDQVIDSLEIVKKEAEAAKIQAEKEEAAASRDKYSIGLILVGIIAVLVFIGFIQIRRRGKLLSEQNTLINAKNEQLGIAYGEIEEKNKDIMDSIQYAKRIQSAILPPNKIVKEYLSQSFVLYKPKDIVAGDFYWMEVVKESGNSTPSNSPEGGEPELPVDPDDSSFGYITTQSKNYKHLKQFAKDMRKNPTEAERAAWELLRNKKTGFNIRRQHIIDEYIVDFGCFDKRLVIEIDGGIHDETKEQDFIRDTALNNLGFDVMRFTNDEVLQSPQEFTNKITSALIERHSVSSKPGSPPSEELEEVGLEQSNIILFAAADCTGHGVPGAMVSVVCNNGLNRAVREHGLTEPGVILDKTREIVISEFEKSEEDVKDGMDIALCSLTFAKLQKEKQSESGKQNGKQSESGSIDSSELDEKDRSASAEATGDTQTVSDYAALLKYAGANNPLWIIRKSIPTPNVIKDLSTAVEMTTNDGFVLEEVKADKQPIGKFDNPIPYATHTIELYPGDTFYIFSDGYADQFGGEKGKKLKAKNFKSLLLSMQHETMERQRELIDEAFEKWKGKYEQLDDVCVIGVRV